MTMEERDGEHVLREELRRLRTRMNVLVLLTMLAVAAGVTAIAVVLRRTPNTHTRVDSEPLSRTGS